MEHGRSGHRPRVGWPDLAVPAATAVAAFLLPPTGRAGARAGFDPVELAARGLGSAALVVLAAALLVGRRRWPVAVWAGTLGLALIDTVLTDLPSRVMIPLLVALFGVAARTDRRTAVAVGAATGLVLVATVMLVTSIPFGTDATYALVAFCALATASGDAVRSQASAVRAANERAAAAEASREDEARRQVVEERLRIARELHDVVAHHVSVINVQAGVATHLLESDPAGARQALGHVRAASGQAIAEMRGMVGLLRIEEAADVVEPPAPGLGQVPALLAGMRSAGLEVAFEDDATGTEVPATVGLTAYRVIQEALTNAAKHGTGTAVVELHRDRTGLQIRVTNPVRPGLASQSGHGLPGMRERVAAAGGSVEVTPGPPFVVRAALPVDGPAR